jgi:hypothetical protein
MSRVQELFKVGESIGRRLELIYTNSGKELGSIESDAGFNPQLRAIQEYNEYTEKIKDQLVYVCQNVDDYNRVWNGTMRDYYFALTKFIQSIPKEKK